MVETSEVYEDQRARVRTLAEDLLLNLGYELVELEFAQSDENALLRLYIDREDGITLDDCTHVSRMLGALLDVEDPISGRYNLEISSPGLNRRLSRPKDFQTRLGETIKVKLVKPLNGRRRFKGILRDYQENPMTVTIEVDGETFIVPLDETSRCSLVYNFNKR
ncbi:MAG: ribosome maturation factor RimP [Pseudomonadota bacterium]|nr:ribosome maturation factor RimP [Pseudomonadota bacterium]